MTKLFWKEVRKGDHLRLADEADFLGGPGSLLIAVYDHPRRSDGIVTQDVQLKAREHFAGKVLLVLSEPRPHGRGGFEMEVMLEGRPTRIASLAIDYSDWIRCA